MFCISLKNNNLEASVIIKFDRMFEHLVSSHYGLCLQKYYIYEETVIKY